MAKKADTKIKKSTAKKSDAKKKIKEDNLAIPGSLLDDMAIATDFLVTSKAAVRNLAVAITETATPEVKNLLRRELDLAIDTHDKIAQYMIKNDMYHAYNIEEQVEHDLKKADVALELIKNKNFV
ncbi:spore coat protein [Planococcus sp. 4-30]|uniref:spore coat protein n=1 Tax=Planococcus sp. 4-30 TaxID=2874583 RepID=UPI0039898B37